jgi:hypothetical protein
VLKLSTTPGRRIGKWRYSSTHSTSALDGGEWSASRPARFTPSERAPGTHWIEGWVGPRAVLDAVVKRKIPSPSARNLTLEPDRPARSLVATPTELSRLYFHWSYINQPQSKEIKNNSSNVIKTYTLSCVLSDVTYHRR